jgi:adenosylcobinamide kinase/adenosylcobinamide-phosphate guanylyltransferase
MPELKTTIATSELILGGQKSGKSRRAELLARQWLQADAAHRAVLVATGQAWDAEMAARIARHKADRALRAPGLATVEEPLALADALRQHSRPGTLVVVDCLTLWLTNRLMPAHQDAPMSDADDTTPDLVRAIQAAPGPLVLVGNEIGLGVIPMGRDVRAFVDALGQLNQAVAAACTRVTLMAAGLPLTLKDETHHAF